MGVDGEGDTAHQVETLTRQFRMIVEDARAANGQRIDVAEIETRAPAATDSLLKAAACMCDCALHQRDTQLSTGRRAPTQQVPEPRP